MAGPLPVGRIVRRFITLGAPHPSLGHTSAPIAPSIDIADSHPILSKFGVPVVHLLRLGACMNDCDYEKLLAQLMRLEGGWLAPFCDAAGNLIVAADGQKEHASIGLEGMTLLESHVRRVAGDLEDILPVVGRLDAVRQRVLIHMAFNMGVKRLVTMPRFISAVQFRNWEAAAKEMMISDWAKQEQRRANVLAHMMRTGRDEPESISERRSGHKSRS